MAGMPLDVTSSLRAERASLLALLRDLSDDEWTRPTECPAWTVKGLALHILGDDLSLLTRQRDASVDSLTLFAEDHPGYTFRELLDGFNEHWVSGARFLSIPLLIELLRLVGDWSADFYESVGLDTIAREPVQFFANLEPSPYWQVIAREYAERVIHQSQIRRALGRPDVDGDVLATMARLHAHWLAAWMRDLDPGSDATVAFIAGSVGEWTMIRGRAGWRVADAVGKADATITMSEDHLVALLTRGYDAAGVQSAVTFTGDTTLARAAFDPVVALLARPT
jgi:uncharacterized protein (TIGR03083 family)